MSLILDALRKSEAARRRSETPDLFSSMPQAAEPTRALAGWPLWAFGAASAAAVLIAVWWFAGRGPDGIAPPATADQSSPSAPATSTTRSPEETPAPRRDATLSPPPPMPGPTPGTVANIGPAPSPNLPPPAQGGTTGPRGNASAGDATPASTLDAPSPAVVATAPSPAPPPPATDRIASLAEFDPETRKQLPPLKLSMHLWNDTASQRFVILDGQRLKEGDVLGELVIERITRDGVVLAWRGARLRLDR